MFLNSDKPVSKYKNGYFYHTKLKENIYSSKQNVDGVVAGGSIFLFVSDGWRESSFNHLKTIIQTHTQTHRDTRDHQIREEMWAGKRD